MKTAFNSLADFDTNSGCTENIALYQTLPPGINVGSGDSIIHDASAFANIGLEAYVRFSDVTASQFRVILGATVAGVGKALDFNLTASSMTVSFVNITTFTGTAASTTVSKEFYPRLQFLDDVWNKIKIICANGILRVYVGGYFVFQSNVFVASGNYWGYSGMSTSNDVIISDTYLYQNQVFYGNVNINGSPDASGVAVMFNQVDGNVIDYQQCNDDGDYVILITDSPAALKKYFLIGYIRDEPGVQPRGVGNLTL